MTRTQTTLIRPSARDKLYQGLSDDIAAIEVPLWMLLRATQLEQSHHKIRVVDLEIDKLNDEGLEADNFEIFPWGSNPTAFVQQSEAVKNLLGELRGKIIVWNCLPEFDYNIQPAWHYADFAKYRAHGWHCLDGSSRSPYGVIFTSYGCPFKCQFCNTRVYYPKYFERNISDVLRDICVLVDSFGVKKIKIIDEMFFLKSARVEALCDLIIKNGFDLDIWAYARIDTINPQLLSKMRKAGFRWLALGIESGSERIRRDVNKGGFTNEDIRAAVRQLKDHNIHVIGNYIFGFPNDDFDTMQETLDFAIELNCEHANFHSLMPFPGSAIREYALEKKWQLPSKWSSYGQYSYDCYPLRTNFLSNAEVLKFRDDAFKTYFSNPNYLQMIKRTFGDKAREKIEETTKIELRRNLCESSVEGGTCPICGKELFDKGNLKEHFKYEHENLKLPLEVAQ